MTKDEAIAIIRNEYKCVDRDCDIDRSCGKCDLMIPSKEPILQAYNMAIQALEQKPCEDAISREAVKELIKSGISTDTYDDVEQVCKWVDALPPVKPQEPKFIVKSDGTIEQIKNCDECLFKKEWEKISKLLSVLEKQTEQEQKTGHWIEPRNDDGMSDPIYYQVRCSECGFDLDPQTWDMDLRRCGADKYCPSCGARMRGAE